MADLGPLGGVKITGFISPTDTNDTYAVIDPIYGIDGLRNLTGGTTDLDLIPDARRRTGMLVGVQVSGGTEYYQLLPTPWSGTFSDWTLLNLGTGTSGQTLGETLVLGNTTDGNDIIMSTGDTITSLDSLSNLTVSNAFTQLSRRDNRMSISDTSVFFQTSPSTTSGSSYTFILGGGDVLSSILVDQSFGHDGGLWVENNRLGVDLSGGTRRGMPVSLSAEDWIIKQNVINSNIVGGVGVTVKTDNTLYLNQIGYSVNKNPFELIISATTPTSDRVQTHQDADGVIALLTDLSGFSSTNTFVSGITFNTGNYDLTVGRNDGTSFTESLAILAGDMVVTGGTYDINTGIVEFTNNSGGTFNVSGFTSGMTDSYTTTATTSGNIISFDNNILGSGLYSVDLTDMLATGGVWTAGTGTNSAVLANTGNIASGDGAVAEGGYWGKGSLPTTASGVGSHAEGGGTVASGETSHSEGFNTIAGGNYSHAEGIGNIASGEASHAEGLNTIASGENSHAEGAATISSSAYSHAEGFGSVAYGSASHAEGALTTAATSNTHAEGQGTLASGTGAHAEGRFTEASGLSSHAEGNATVASGENSHAEGDDTVASGDGSHSEGIGNIASGDASHAEGGDFVGKGFYNIASGDASHAEGLQSVASGNASHSEGFNTLASGNNSHAEGLQTIASGDTSHAEGINTIAGGDYSHAEGNATVASGENSHAEGAGSVASGQTSHAEGIDTIASGDGSHSEGIGNIASGDASHAEGGYFDNNGTPTLNPTSATTNSAHAEGAGTLASGDVSHAEGLDTVASGTTSHAEGHLTIAGGESSHAEGGLTTASGARSHAEGLQTTASGFAAHAEGYQTSASGQGSHSEGINTTAGGVSSHAGGDSSIANGNVSFIHSTNSLVSGDRSVVLGGQNITGATADTVYVPNLVVVTSFTPSGSGDTHGGIGSMTWDDNYVYTKTSTGWGRSSLDYGF